MDASTCLTKPGDAAKRKDGLVAVVQKNKKGRLTVWLHYPPNVPWRSTVDQIVGEDWERLVPEKGKPS